MCNVLKINVCLLMESLKYMNISLFSVAGIWSQKSDDFGFCGFAKQSRRRCVEK